MRIYRKVLGVRQEQALDRLAPILTPRGFYLAGGTAIALQLGHRRSVDLDWFTREPIARPLALAQLLRRPGVPFVTESVASNTLHGSISGVRISLLTYSYPLLKPVLRWKGGGANLASLDDLGAMKLAALSQRGARKDFADLYALIRKHGPLPTLIKNFQRRFHISDLAHVLYSLSYFADAERDPALRMLWKISWPRIRKGIQRHVAELSTAALARRK